MVKRDEMPRNMITKILKETAPHVESVLPFLYQEPMMESRLLDILKEVKDINNRCKTAIYTNADLLTRDKSEQLIKSQLLDAIYISFYGPTKELHDKYQHGLDWHKVQQNIYDLMAVRAGYRIPRVTMWYIEIPELMEELDKMEHWKTIVDDFGIVGYETFSGLVPALVDYQPKERQPCGRLYQSINILSDGTMVPCCLDYSGSVNLGNAFEENVIKLWTGDKMNALRELHRNKDWSALPNLCKNCTVHNRV